MIAPDPAAAPRPATPDQHLVLRRAGTRALLLDLDGLAAAMAWHAELTANPLPGQVEALAAASTVLLTFAEPRHAAAARGALAGRVPGAGARREPVTHTIEVAYSGEDLAEVARLTGLSPEGVVAAHTGTPWTGAFGGFAPGFTYLSGGDPVLDVPRRGAPRTAVPAGSVALAGRFSAIYPRRSPGGWQLLGTTEATLWDTSREAPALIAPGDVVTFVPVHDVARLAPGRDLAESGAADDAAGEPGSAPEVAPGAVPTAAPAAVPVGDAGEAGDAGQASPPAGLTVRSPGLLTLVQDAGRPGLGNLGVTVSGAADRASAAQVNRLVGNAPTDAVLETLLGGLELRAESTQVLALSGAIGEAVIHAAPESAFEGEQTGAPQHATKRATPGAAAAWVAPVRAPFALYAGQTLRLGAPEAGLRGYVAVRGGIEAPLELGSRASDSLSGLGPAAVRAGDRLAVGHPNGAGVVGHPEGAVTALPTPGEAVVLRAVAGPRDDWFGPEGLAALQERTWAVTAQSDRVGARLEIAETGERREPLRRVREGELASEGVVAGSLQVPPSGLPVLFLADHPVTGGYPVIAVVVPGDVDRAAQLPPGTPVRIELIEPDPATEPPAVEHPTTTHPTQGAHP